MSQGIPLHNYYMAINKNILNADHSVVFNEENSKVIPIME
jgi:hypothetical protein